MGSLGFQPLQIEDVKPDPGGQNMLLIRGEFRAVIIDKGKVVAFVPSDPEGKKRTGMTIRVHDEAAAGRVAEWFAPDPVFWYDDVEGENYEAGFLNKRTGERVVTFEHRRPKTI
jgi:hypothetical protein